MNLSGIAVLRTRLRELNIEYSALVRRKAGEGTFEKMGQLGVDRRALMTLIAEERLKDFECHSAVCSSSGALSLAGSETDAASCAAAGLGAGASSGVASGGDVLSILAG
jgi:hypothetical protein